MAPFKFIYSTLEDPVKHIDHMTLYALDDLDDALAATKAFLWPPDRSRWIKLALVVFFVGGPGANFNAVQYNLPAGPRGSTTGLPPELGPRLWLLVGILVVAAIVLGLALLLVGSIMEFVLVESIRAETVAVRRYWGTRWRQGLRLFGFRIAVGFVVIGSIGIFALLAFLPVAIGTGAPTGGLPGGASLLALLFVVPVIVVLAILVGLINGFTTVFVVPIMLLEDCGVLAGWRRLWPTIAANPWQYLAYAIVAFVLQLAGGIVVAIAIGVAVLLLLIPFGVLGLIGYLLWTTVPPAGLAFLVVFGALFALSVLALFALAQVPVVAYLRYYALLVLGDIDDDLDLIAERRAAIREANE